MKQCEILAGCSEEPDRLTRPFATDAMKRAHEHVSRWMTEAGMTVQRDNVGNLRGRYEGASPNSPTLILGSHLDSVRFVLHPPACQRCRLPPQSGLLPALGKRRRPDEENAHGQPIALGGRAFDTQTWT